MSSSVKISSCPVCAPGVELGSFPTQKGGVCNCGSYDSTPTLIPVRPAAKDARLGTRLGDFELVRELGRGGMGAVYEAVDLVLNRSIAIKVLSGTDKGQEQDQVQRLIKEARAVAQLDHPNIVSIYQIGRENDQHFIAMQLVRGRSAGATLRQHGPLKPEEALRVIREASQGLAAVHALGLIHRDIKPDNILLGENGSVKVADFGLARQQATSSSVTGGTGVVGTPHYMSPEQVQGLPLDARTDIYSLGATWYCLLVGRPPFPGTNAFEVMSQHVYDAPPNVTLLRSDVPATHVRLIERMMAKDSSSRPPDGAALLAAFRPLDAPVEATERLESPAKTGRRSKRLKRSRSTPAHRSGSRGWLGAVGVVIGSVLLSVGGAWVYHTANASPQGKAVLPGDDEPTEDQPQVQKPTTEVPRRQELQPERARSEPEPQSPAPEKSRIPRTPIGKSFPLVPSPTEEPSGKSSSESGEKPHPDPYRPPPHPPGFGPGGGLPPPPPGRGFLPPKGKR